MTNRCLLAVEAEFGFEQDSILLCPCGDEIEGTEIYYDDYISGSCVLFNLW